MPYAYGRAIDGRDHRLVEVEDATGHATAAVPDVAFVVGLSRQVFGVFAPGLAALFEIRAGAEGPARAGDDHHLDVIVGIGAIEGGDQLVAHAAVERVHAVRAIERNREDASLDLIAQCVEFHGEVPTTSASP
jgi:hypothetical protein